MPGGILFGVPDTFNSRDIMNKINTLAMVVALALSACAANPSQIDTRRLSYVEENHAEIVVNNKAYILDSYIVPFQRPYYVLVKAAAKNALTKSEAEAVAVEYIKPRGCTTPLSRRADLDRSSSDKTSWLIGVEC